MAPGRRRRPVPRSAHPRRAVSVRCARTGRGGARGRPRPARDVVDEHLAVVDAARAGAARVQPGHRRRGAGGGRRASTRAVGGGDDPGPLAGVPIVLKDNLCTRGVAHHVLVEASSKGWRPPYTATVVERVVARRRGPGRQDQPRRVRDGLVHRELGVRAHPQPARPVARARRFERRFGGRGRRRVRAARARLRHRWLDPSAGGAVRGRRREAHLRPGVALRPDRVRELARSDRPVRHHRSPTPRCCST